VFIQRFPGAVQIALDNRGCLVRAVDYMAREIGLDQFIDLGSGLPTADNVHQVAQRVNPQARVVYLDNDPIVLAHGRALLMENDHTTVLKADIRQSEEILGSEELRALVDLGRPVGVIASAILHHITDAENPLGLIRTFRDALPAGSCLFISHFRTLGDPDSAALEKVMLEAFGRGVWRTTDQIAEYFDGTELAEPGIVPCAQWRPGKEPGELTAYQRLIVAGLGRM
jgi:S-adenosyl methyltransferase